MHDSITLRENIECSFDYIFETELLEFNLDIGVREYLCQLPMNISEACLYNYLTRIVFLGEVHFKHCVIEQLLILNFL